MSKRMTWATGSLALSIVIGAAVVARAQEAPSLEGRWKIVVLAFGEDEFAVLDVKKDGNALQAKVLDAQAFLGQPEVTSAAVEDGTLTLQLKTSTGPSTFTGRLPAKVKSEPILGTFEFREQPFPARMVRTDAEKIGALSEGAILSKLLPLRRLPDAKERYAKVKALIEENPESPTNSSAYGVLLESADAADAPPEEVRKLVETWVGALEAYGPQLANDTRVKALQALAGKKPYAELALEIGKAADKGLGESAPASKQVLVVGLLAKAADNAGDELLARSARERAEKLESRLDDEYRAKVPPFKPEAFDGREDKANDRVVLMELFTGAQCPPCVAADVAFDALIDTYKPAEFIGLQYHLHIPGPDPMTNPATLDRAKYYQATSTPTTIFNGEPQGRGGGIMSMSKGKYDEYRKYIEAQLDEPKKAAIDLSVKREGDTITIDAAATAEGADDKSKPRLRLALVEESVKYVGGNGLRFHHHVVRDLPGGVAGVEFADGKAKASATVDLAKLRETLEAYLSDYAKNRTFPGTLPPLDMKHLAVVAFVQDDVDKAVWHAVLQPAGSEKAE